MFIYYSSLYTKTNEVHGKKIRVCYLKIMFQTKFSVTNLHIRPPGSPLVLRSIYTVFSSYLMFYKLFIIDMKYIVSIDSITFVC